MTRQILMIATAIVALAAAPAVLAQGTTSGKSPAPAVTTSTTPSTGQAKMAAQSKNKMTHKASVSAKGGKSTYREMNAREVEMTRTLNREAQSKAGIVRFAMAPTPMLDQVIPMQGAALAPKNEPGATGPGNTGDSPTSNK